jgi:hypothetical protein
VKISHHENKPFSYVKSREMMEFAAGERNPRPKIPRE